jgi:hypothetical protein
MSAVSLPYRSGSYIECRIEHTMTKKNISSELPLPLGLHASEYILCFFESFRVAANYLL